MWRMLFLGVAPAIASTIGLDGVLHTQYTGQYSSSLYALNKDGSTKWIFDTDASMGPHAEGLNNTVYATVTGKTNALFSLDGLDGSIKWKHQVDENRRIMNTLVVAIDGTIYFVTTLNTGPQNSTTSTTIDAIDTAGAVKWSFTKVGYGILTEVGIDGTPFFLSKNSLDALQPDTGNLKWSMKIGSYHSTYVSTKDSNVFVLQENHPQRLGVVSSLSNDDGSVLWNYTFSAQGRMFVTLSRNNEVYVSGATSDGTCGLQVLDFNGKALRNLPCLSDDSTYNDEEDMFVSVSKSNVLAQSGTDGRLLWNASVPESPPYSPYEVNFGQDGTVLVWNSGVTSNGQVHAIRNDGRVIWSVQTGRASQQLMVEDGTTYVDGRPCHKCHGSDLSGFDVVAIGADGSEKWMFTATESAAELVTVV